MKPTEELKAEHRAIEQMLRIMEQVCIRLESSEAVDTDHLEQIVEFIQVFADRCHHGKEEDLLFVAMEEAGIPKRGGPIGVMLAEHAMGRDYVREMNRAISAYKAGDVAAMSSIAENAREYIALLAQHIGKEDNILYPMADRALSSTIQRRLAEAFEQVERERTGAGRHEAFHELLDELHRVYLSSSGAAE
jgi:hemerythrin-like domain-containing protein